jgi:ribosome-associated toxin RatA of RatAB toxin-antitoxin module
MKVQSEIIISGTREAIWKAVSEIEKSGEFISSIDSIDVLEKPEEGLIGFKWKETRTMFGKEATEVMTVTEAKESKYYKTYAESHGAVYMSTISIEDSDDTLVLKMEFEGIPVTFKGKLMNLVFGMMMKSSTEKALYQDLVDIKKYVESVKDPS